MEQSAWRLGASLILGIAALTAHSTLEAQGQPTCVLFLSADLSARPMGETNIFAMRAFLPDEKLQQKMAAEGIVWGAERLSTQMDYEYLKQFNVVVMLDFPMIEKYPDLRDVVREKEQLLARFVREGGGLLLTGNTEYGMWGLERDFEEMNRFLQPFDAQVLHEQVDEGSPALVIPDMGAGPLAWTGTVLPHAITEGVRGLLYPTRFAWSYWTHPLQAGNDWQVLVKGSETAYSFSAELGGSGGAADAKRPGTFANAPALIAVRDLEKGRMALWPTVPSAFIIDGYHAFWGGGIVMEGTRGGKPSDGRLLLLSMLKWLGAPSSGAFGGYVRPAEVGVGDEAGFQQVDWDKINIEGRLQPNTYRGLIGMRSSLSTGTSTPEEMIETARAASYDYAAFTEDLSEMQPAAMERLRAVCEAASGPEFQVYPGIAYRDESGNSWATFGRTVTWPRDDWWSKASPGAIGVSNFIFRGYQFPPVILVDSGHNPEPAFLQGNFKAFATHTYRAGKLVDDAVPTYIDLQHNGYDLVPVVVHDVRSVDELNTASAAPYQTYSRWWELEDVASGLSGTAAKHAGNYVFHRTGFVSSGPVIDDLRIFNFGSADLAIPGNGRWRMHLEVSSARGVREISIADGPKLWRRVLPGGAQTWTGDFEGYQAMNRHFIATVTDIDGGTAVSTCAWTMTQELAMVRCSDNLNTYTSGKFEAVKYHALRGLESYIDQQAGQFTGFPHLGVDEDQRPAVEQRLTLVSPFGYVKDDIIEYSYPPTATANWNRNDIPEVAVPQTALKGRLRTTLFTPRADRSSVYLVEGDYEILRDIDIARADIPCFRSRWVKDAKTVFVSHSDARPQCLTLEDRRTSHRGTLDGVEYVAQISPLGGSRAIVPLQPGLRYDAIYNGENYYLAASVDLPEKKVTAGQRLTYRYLAVWDTVAGKPDTGFIEDIYTTMGLRGATGYTVTPTHGQVLDTRFILRLQADGYGFLGTITRADLPVNLPVYIDGLNERWPAGILYKGKNKLTVATWRSDAVGNRYTEYVPVEGENQLLRFGFIDRIGMLQVDTALGDRDVYIGNLLICDNPDVFLELDDARPGKQVISANNPTDAEVTITIRPGPGFDMLGEYEKTVTIPAGTAVRISL